jgi:3-deoxy-7-phosphoheptulonate synthase/chorismate mutase
VDPALRRLRERLDQVNRELRKLLQERGELVLEVAALKEALGLDSYDPRREAEMMRELTAEGGGPFSHHELETFFRGLFAVSLDLQRRTRASGAAAEHAVTHPQPHIKAVGK